MQYIYDPDTFKRYIYNYCHCINALQSPEERRLKYAIAKSCGKNAKIARVLRDYRNTQFAKVFGYSSLESMLKIIKDGE